MAKPKLVSLFEREDLHFLPIGDGSLTPERAAAWLRDEADVYAELAIACAGCEDHAVHDALVWDLARMARAAGSALTTQKSVAIGQAWPTPDEAEFWADLRGLAHLLGHFEAFDDVQHQEQHVLGALARELEARLAATEVQR